MTIRLDFAVYAAFRRLQDKWEMSPKQALQRLIITETAPMHTTDTTENDKT